MVFAGCGKEQSGIPTARLRGTVTVNGVAIPVDAAGTIIFQPVTVGDTRPASPPIKDGKYDIAQTSNWQASGGNSHYAGTAGKCGGPAND